MKRAFVILGLLALLVPATSCPPTSNPDQACDVRGCISLSKFAANIVTALNNNQVVGYVATVGSQPPVFGGYAQTAADFLPAGLGMAPDLTTNVASTTKIVTTIAVLQSLFKHNLTLDSPIAPYLWSDWTTGANLGGLTFRQLLTHQSGFRYSPTDGCGTGPGGTPLSCNTNFYNCNGSNTAFGDVKSTMANGVDTKNVGAPQYNNCNFAIFRELLPFMEGYTYTGANDDGSKAQWSDNIYVNYVNQNILQPLGIPMRDCQPPDNGGNQFILSYPNPPLQSKGTNWGNAWELACGGGGWQLSEDDLYRIAKELATGNMLLSDSMKTQMNAVSATLPSPKGLGWDNTVRNDCPDPYPCKNGNLNGSDNIWTYMGIFKCGIPVTVVVNSALPAPYQDTDSNGNTLPSPPNHTDIIGLVGTAYKNAITTDAGVCCDGETICGAQCCGPSNPVCCGGACCGNGSQCVGGACCPPDRVCGGACCTTGQFCDSGACIASCAPPLRVSTSPTGSKMCCPSVSCGPMRACPANSCPGVCCGAGQVCCSSDGVVAHQVCNDPASCFKG